jgi:hypothetical protein
MSQNILKYNQAIAIGALDVNPSNPPVGTLYYDTVTDEIKVYKVTWELLATQAYVNSIVATAAANLTLSNLTAPTAVNVPLLPDSTDSRELGSFTTRWGSSWFFTANSNSFNVRDFTAPTAAESAILSMIDGVETPSGISNVAAIRLLNSLSSQPRNALAILTRNEPVASPDASRPILIETGTAQTNRNTGDIRLRTSTATGSGIRGAIGLEARQIDLAADILPTTSGSFSLGSSSLRFSSLFAFNANIVSTIALNGGVTNFTSGSNINGLESTLLSTSYTNGWSIQTENSATNTRPIRILSGNTTGGLSDSGLIEIKTGDVIGGTRGLIRLDGSAIDVTNKKIINLADPTNDQDAATKIYVDNAVSLSSGANLTLSNLTNPTSVNQDLIPSSHNSRSLGSASTNWLALYTNSIRDAGDNISINPINRLLETSGGVSTVDWEQSQLVTDNVVKLDWSGANISVNTRKITDLADPTNDQDAATKAYVDALSGGPNYTAGDGLELNGLEFSVLLDGDTLFKSSSGLKVNSASYPENIVPENDLTVSLGSSGNRWEQIYSGQNFVHKVHYRDQVSEDEYVIERAANTPVVPSGTAILDLGDIGVFSGHEIVIAATDSVTDHRAVYRITVAAKTNAANSSMTIQSTETGTVDAVITLVDNGANVALHIASTNGIAAKAKVTSYLA